MNSVNDYIRSLYKQKSEDSKKILDYKQRMSDIIGISEIDDEISTLGLKYATLIAAGKLDSDTAIEKMNVELLNLKNRKNSILLEHNIENLDVNYDCTLCKDMGSVGGKLCSCATPHIKKYMLEMSKYISGTMPDIENQNFKNFDFRFFSKECDNKLGHSAFENIKSINIICRDFCDKFQTEHENLYLYGPSGTGKTFMTNCIAESLLSRGFTVLCLSAYKTFNFITDYNFDKIDRKENKKYIDAMYECDVLIIDDLGSEFKTTYTSTVFFDLLNTRIANKKCLIITSNLSPRSIQTSYTDRIQSRLCGDFQLLRFGGDDIRLIKRID